MLWFMLLPFEVHNGPHRGEAPPTHLEKPSLSLNQSLVPGLSPAALPLAQSLWGLTANSMIAAQLLLVCVTAMRGCRAVTSVARLPCPYLGRCLQNYLLVQQLHHHFHVALLGGQVQGVQPILEEAKVGKGN